MKTIAIKEMKLMIQAVLDKGKEEIINSVKTAKTQAIKDINTEYEAILKDLSDTDTTKEETENRNQECY